MKKILVAIACFLFGATFNTIGMAQYIGPSGIPAMSVNQLLEQARDDQYVTLRGKIIRHLGGEHYLFSDGNGEICVEIEPHLFQGRTISADTQVEIDGELDKSILERDEVEVDALRIVP